MSEKGFECSTFLARCCGRNNGVILTKACSNVSCPHAQNRHGLMPDPRWRAVRPSQKQCELRDALPSLWGVAKETTYPELVNSGRCHLTVLGIEIGGRWSAEAATSVRLLARCRARAAPDALAISDVLADSTELPLLGSRMP